MQRPTIAALSLTGLLIASAAVANAAPFYNDDAGRALPQESPPAPDEIQPAEKPQDQHFCCKSVDAKSRTGDGCIMASKKDVKLCNANILYCPGFYTLDTNGAVECPK